MNRIRRFRFVILAFGFVLFPLFQGGAAPSQLTELEKLAASMEVGSWAELVTANLNETLFSGGGYMDRTILEYADSGTWDPIREQFLFVGGGHEASKQFVKYSAATNTWSIMPDPYWLPRNTMHAYDHNAINAAGGQFYHRPFENNALNVYKLDIASGVWSQLPRIFTNDYFQCCIGIEYFPEMGGLIVSNNGGGSVYLFNDSKQEWSQLTSGLEMGDYHGFAEYNPVHKVVVFGGGNNSNRLYRLNADGSITTLKDAPSELRTNEAVFSVDPVSGDYLVLAEGLTLYAFDPMSDTWRVADPNPPIPTITPNNPFNVIAAPISNYGVTMFVTTYRNPSESEVWLYKHSSGTIPPVREGDINLDGVVDDADVHLCARIVLELETDAALRLRADVNKDGMVSVLDVQRIVNLIPGD